MLHLQVVRQGQTRSMSDQRPRILRMFIGMPIEAAAMENLGVL